MAWLARDLAHARRRMDRPFAPAGPAFSRYLFRSRRRAWRYRARQFAVAPRVRDRTRQCRLRQAAGRKRGLGGAGLELLRRVSDRRGPHRPEEGGAVRRGHARACACHPPSRGCPLDTGAARGLDRAWARRHPGPCRPFGRTGRLPRPHPGATDRGHRRRNPGDQQGRDEARLEFEIAPASARRSGRSAISASSRKISCSESKCGLCHPCRFPFARRASSSGPPRPC